MWKRNVRQANACFQGLAWLWCAVPVGMVLWVVLVSHSHAAVENGTISRGERESGDQDPPDDSGSPEGVLYFEKHVRPILKAHCFLCHGEEPEKSGQLDLRLVRLMQEGGDSGAALVPGAAADSLIWQRVGDDDMPPGPKKLSAAEKQLLHDWVNQGAQTARAEPTDPRDARFTAEELGHWAFQPIRRPELPPGPTADEALTPLDRFVSAGLSANGFEFAPVADRRVLLRRLSFNLIGLPPTVEETEAFLRDSSPTAYESVVERLLASPHYGERWGRHWLDVAGYAESEGQVVGDRHRPHAWRFRDYVVDAWNRDVPYNQFIVEQLAGDQCLEGAPDPNNDHDARLLAATGFLQMAPDLTQTEDTVVNRNQAVADTVQTVTSAILGLTVACAQCHDHRYDPITIEDYYRLRAVFDPAFPLVAWRRPAERLVDLTDDATKGRRAEIEAAAVALQEDINSRRRAHCQTIQDREIAAAPEDVHQALRQAVTTPAAEQSDAQKALLEAYPKVRSIDWIVGQLVEYDGPAHRAFQEEEKKVAEIRDSKPLDRLLMATVDANLEAPSHVFFRGNPESPLDAVLPGELEVLGLNRTSVREGELDARQRRRAYATQLTDGTHPLVARVVVNRVWQHHFGQGLVRTPGDFGLHGQPPTHPALLDYLAHEFMAQGWSLKWLQRQIVLSRTFQQASGLPAETAVALAAPAAPSSPGGVRDAWREDPDNRWLGRMSLRRLDAEAVRDAILAVSGQLNPQIGGPSVPIAEDDEGKAVIGTRILQDGLFAGIKDAGAEAHRRSLYLSAQRSLQLNLLQTFDFPEMKPNCQVRGSSTVTPQALLLMNDAWVVQAADQMAERLRGKTTTVEEQVQMAFELTFTSLVTAEELAAVLNFLDRQTAVFLQDPDPTWQQQLSEQPEAAQHRALASFCQLLLASNRFLYLE
jgi:hypothetical protein